MDKEDVVWIYTYMYVEYIHTHIYIILVIKKNEIMPFAATWLELSEVSQKEKDQYYMISLKCEI